MGFVTSAAEQQLQDLDPEMGALEAVLTGGPNASRGEGTEAHQLELLRLLLALPQATPPPALCARVLCEAVERSTTPAGLAALRAVLDVTCYAEQVNALGARSGLTRTPLMAAARIAEATALLLERGARPGIVAPAGSFFEGYTALMLACRWGTAAVPTLLATD